LRRTAIPLGLVWLTAFNLRVVLFAIPPSLPAIRSDLGLSFSATGSITSVTVLALGLASIPGALLAGRYGSRRLVTACGFGLASAAASMALPPATFWVFAGAGLLAVSIGVAQPPLSVLIRRWFHGAITRATNLYGNGLLIGNVAGASLSPYLVRLLGWRSMFLVWAAFVLAGVVLWIRLTPRDDAAAPAVSVRALASDPRVWQVAALFTFQNIAYYTVATWMPFALSSRGPGYVAVAFLFLNCLPILPLLALSVVPWQYALSATYYAGAGLLTVAGALGMLLGLTGLFWLLAFLVGLGAAAAFIGALALPPLLAADESEAAGYSAFMFAAGYVLAFAGPVSAGALVDATGQVSVAFWPAIGAGVLMAVVGSLMPRLLVRSGAAPAR
jgi:MFS transporter, CP family, cyanate transporter